MNTPQVAASLEDEFVTITVPADQLARLVRHDANDWVARQLARDVEAALPDVDRGDVALAVRGVPWLGYAQQDIRRGLVEGRAVELDNLRADAEYAAMDAAALLRLVDHVEATHPRARRRARRHG